ncbi:signal peptide peptidase SppA [Bradyrhizobium sp. USDA 3240]
MSNTAVSFEHLKAQLFNRPLLVDADRIAVIIDSIADRTGVAFDPAVMDGVNSRLGQLPAEARKAMRGPARPRTHAATDKLYPVVDGTAIVAVHGSLLNRGSWIGAYSGITTYEGLRRQFRQAGADDDVKSIILDVDSAGGQAAGAMELASVVRELRASKPIIAVVNDCAASAAFAIASAATKVLISPSGVAGSIGVVLVHLDHSARLDKAGVRPTLIHAGARKVDGNPYQALPDGVRTSLQAEVDRYYGMFVETVALNRPALSPAAVRATEAATYIGQAAVDAGLADEIGDIEKALTELQKSNQPVDGLYLQAAARRAAILALPEAVGREDYAASMADRDTPVETAKAALKALPKKAERDARDAAARKAAAEAAAREREKAVSHSWAEIVDQMNARMRS